MAKARKVSAALRERLLGQKQGMSGGRIINNKNFQKGRFRIVPVGDEEVPGKEYLSIYCEAIGKKGTTSPRTFGLACPVLDHRDKVYRTGDKDEKEHVRNIITVQGEYWMGVFDREDMGTAENPNIRILRGKRTVYEAIIAYMVDEDDGEDITDPTAGRDIRVRKEGSGTDTRWHVKFLDREPISEDDDENEQYAAAAAGFDPATSFFDVDWEVLGSIYEALTGEEVPDHYLEQKPTKTTSKKPAKDAEPDEDEPEAEEPEEAEPTSEATGAEASIVEGETIVEFESDDEMVQGVVVKVYQDDEDDEVFDVQTGDDPEEDTWTVYPGDVTVVEEAEPEPEPAPKKAAKKKKKKKSPGKKKPSGKGGKATQSIKDRLSKAKK
jgi:hypothetical protein